MDKLASTGTPCLVSESVEVKEGEVYKMVLETTPGDIFGGVAEFIPVKEGTYNTINGKR